MTPVRFLLIRSGREVAAVFADSKREAEARLRPEPGSYVTSEASWRVPVPKAVQRVLGAGLRTCERCRVRERADGSRWCLSCKAFKEREARLNETQNARATRLGLRRGRDRTAENAARRARRAARKVGTPLPEGALREMRARLDAVSGDVGKVRVWSGGRPTLVSQRAAHAAKRVADALARRND